MKFTFKSLRIAVVYDHLTTRYGGAELVLKQLLSIFPQAELFTTVFDPNVIDWIDPKRVHTTGLQKLGPFKRFHQLLLPFHPFWIEQLDLSEFDLIISVSAGTAKGILTMPGQLHVCYLLTPPRYLQMNKQEFLDYAHSHHLNIIPGLTSMLEPILRYLKTWDRQAAWRPDKIIAISNLVSDRMSTQYNRKADKVIYPPFVTPQSSLQPQPQGSNFLLSFSRLTSYKRIDLSIKAAIQTKKLLVVAGQGPANAELRSIAALHGYVRKQSQSITTAIEEAVRLNRLIIFVGSCSELEKQYLFSNCKALLMPGIEDFGLIGLEAAAFGKPVITHAKSGVAEVLKTPTYAVHITEQTVSALSSAISALENLTFDPFQLQKYSEQYNEKHFEERLLNTLYQFWSEQSTISP